MPVIIPCKANNHALAPIKSTLCNHTHIIIPLGPLPLPRVVAESVAGVPGLRRARLLRPGVAHHHARHGAGRGRARGDAGPGDDQHRFAGDQTRQEGRLGDDPGI